MSTSNGNPTPEDEFFDTGAEEKQMAIELTDRTLTAIGGLESVDPMDAAEQVAQMFLRFLQAVRDEE